MPIILSEWEKDQSDTTIQNIISRGIKTNKESLRIVLSHMGRVMSLRKLHRKIGVMMVVLEMKEGETLSTKVICDRANENIRKNASLGVESIASICRLICRWGYLMEIPETYDSHNYMMFARTDKNV